MTGRLSARAMHRPAGPAKRRLIGPILSACAAIVASMLDGLSPDAAGIGQAERVRLGSLRYATVPEATDYLAIMRTFTHDIAGLLSAQSAAEAAARLGDQGLQAGPEHSD